ncbi:MAG: hypothetical protein IPJ60_14915 [Sphingobacteriaceae bacterium]|nr:hypothetical protein [Sphingobacteriaceae bacterium]
MNIGKYIFAIIVSLLVSQKTVGQVDSVYTGEPKIKDDKKKQQKSERFKSIQDKITYGGMIMPGFYASQYGNVVYVTANPNIGYRLTDEFTIGLGLNYSYTSLKNRYGKYTQSIYGPGAFGRYKIFDRVFLQVQYDKLNQPDYYSGTDKRIWVDYLYAGGGYFQSFGENAGLMYSILYNLTPGRNSIYYNPLIQIGFVAGF